MKYGEIDRLFKDRSVFEHTRIINIEFEETKEEYLKKDIKSRIVEWLKEENSDPLKEVKLYDKDGKQLFEYLQFKRSEIYVKTCCNVWEVWRIATAHNWPEIISYKVKEIGLNDYNEDVVPNEIRDEAYSFSEDHAEEIGELMKEHFENDK